VVARAGGGWAVAMLTEVQSDTSGSDPDALRQLVAEVGQGRAADIATVFRRMLTTRHAVEINGGAIEQLFADQ
jgi:hypothetical protein